MSDLKPEIYKAMIRNRDMEIEELISESFGLKRELKAKQEVIDKLGQVFEAANTYVRHSYEPDCKGDLMRFNELKALINSIGEDK